MSPTPSSYLQCALCAGFVLAVAACGGAPRPRDSTPEWHPPSAMLTRYADKNGVVTRGAMEAGLRVDFDKLDATHKGCLTPDEVEVENQRRWKQDASTASPLIDWKQQGCVDFEEFAATPRSLFSQLDRNDDGKLTPEELHARGGVPRD